MVMQNKALTLSLKPVFIINLRVFLRYYDEYIMHYNKNLIRCFIIS